MKEARIQKEDTGLVAEGEGWFVLNLAEASWEHMAEAGTWCAFEAEDAPFSQLGVNVHIVEPGQANGRYHFESAQEDFFVLDGECIAIVEGEERRLRKWDLFHCPPGTGHILVGAGDGPCAILMLGARLPDHKIHYPVDETAARHRASVTRATDSAKEAYADQARKITRVPAPWAPSA